MWYCQSTIMEVILTGHYQTIWLQKYGLLYLTLVPKNPPLIASKYPSHYWYILNFFH